MRNCGTEADLGKIVGFRDRPPSLNSVFPRFSPTKMLSLLNQIEQSGLATSIHESGSLWGYPLILFLHTIGFGTLVGINAAIDLRLLGFGAGIPLKSFEKTFRLMWAGFALNAATGSLLFITDAVKHGTNPAFYVKLTFVAAGLFVLTRIRKNVFRASGIMKQRS